MAYHAVMHNLIPVFTCHDAEQHCDGLPCGGEVCVPDRDKDRGRNKGVKREGNKRGEKNEQNKTKKNRRKHFRHCQQRQE